MLIMFQNCIGWDHLEDEEDLQRIENPVMTHDEGRCWFEIADGDVSLQRKLGESWEWSELLEGDYSDGSDVIVAPTELREFIAKDLMRLGFTPDPGYFYDEDRWSIDTEV